MKTGRYSFMFENKGDLDQSRDAGGGFRVTNVRLDRAYSTRMSLVPVLR